MTIRQKRELAPRIRALINDGKVNRIIRSVGKEMIFTELGALMVCHNIQEPEWMGIYSTSQAISIVENLWKEKFSY